MLLLHCCLAVPDTRFLAPVESLCYRAAAILKDDRTRNSAESSSGGKGFQTSRGNDCCRGRLPLGDFTRLKLAAKLGILPQRTTFNAMKCKDHMRINT